MDMTNESKMQIAVLIDSENVSSRYASIIFNEIETLRIRHISENLRQLDQE